MNLLQFIDTWGPDAGEWPSDESQKSFEADLDALLRAVKVDTYAAALALVREHVTGPTLVDALVEKIAECDRGGTGDG